MFKQKLEAKILGLVVASLLFGFLIEFSFNYFMDSNEIKEGGTERGQALADVVTKSIEDSMLEGRADTSRRLITNLGTVRGVELLQVIRQDGSYAFTDLSTLDTVLKKAEKSDNTGVNMDAIKKEKTDLQGSGQKSSKADVASTPYFKKALESEEEVVFEERINGKEMLTLLRPMKNKTECQTCHGADHKVRGIVRISLSMEETRQDLQNHVKMLFGISLFVIILNTLLLRTWIKRFIINPLLKVADAARHVAAGNIQQTVDVKQSDEIGQLAENFNSLTAEMRAMAEQATAVTKGDLTKHIEGKGELAEAFNSMISTLRVLILQLKEATNQIDASSSDILGSVEHQASGSVELAASVAQVTATIEELTATAKQIAETSGEVETTAEETEESARRGAEMVYDALKAMEAIKVRVADITKKTLVLGEKSRNINEILEIIHEIAGEIHLLALNATIESAAAGEHGKRFAIVAAEVRRLAERTKESATEIKSITTEIQTATNASIMATEQGAKEVESGSVVAEKAGRSLSEIIEMVERTTSAAKQISMATHQQQTASEQVAVTMKEISGITKQSASGLKQSSAAAAQMSRLADDLKGKISHFKADKRQSS
ncbi:MAG: methyl-accepting chemotaxis protein [Nitrospirota bacterium]|nr:methyl-accepting chemotaxis protein [Nitrospirota bacterium]